jgi:tetratricopeptide (TPR) repeat protein
MVMAAMLLKAMVTNSATPSARQAVQNSSHGIVCSSYMDLKRWITPDRAVWFGSILALAAYCRDLRYDFILDDEVLILLNGTIDSWHNWKRLFLTDIMESSHSVITNAMHYRPVYMMWLMMNDQLFGKITPWWHLTSLLLHLVVTLLVYRLGAAVLRENWTAALGALFFAFHPIHVESVAYISASADLLVACFVLVSLLAYHRFRQQEGHFAWLIVSLIAGALAMFSKENALMLPWLFVAYEVFQARPENTSLSYRRFFWVVPYFGLAGAYLAVRTFLFSFNLGPGPDIQGISRLAAFLKAPLVLLLYFRNFLWPLHLSFYYPVAWTSRWSAVKGCAFVLVLLAVWILWRRQRSRPAVRLLLIWTAILFLTPVSGVSIFRNGDWVHDRHMYLVSIPLCLLSAALLTHSGTTLRGSLFAGSLLSLTLLLLTVGSVPRFEDSNSIYASALREAPDNWIAHHFYAIALWNQQRREESLGEHRLALQLAPKSPVTHEAYAAALGEVGRDDEAMTEFRSALMLIPKQPRFRALVLYELAGLEMKSGNYAQAIEGLREAVCLDSQAMNFHLLLARALAHEGHAQEAEEEMRKETTIRKRTLVNPA